MTNSIKCPHCNKEIQIDQVLSHQIEEEILTALTDKHKKELDEIKKSADEESSKRVGTLTKQIEELLDEKRFLKSKAEEMEIEVKKKIIEAEEKIKIDVRQKAEEEFKYKNQEKEKLISDLKNALDDAKRKAEQGSQQLQGEVQELDLEETLKRTYPFDEISEVKKGENGADIRQIVKSQKGTICGTILWESKRTKVWGGDWVAKLKEDLRRDKAHVAVIVSEVLPKEFKKEIGEINGVWITSPSFILPVSGLLRKNLLDIAKEKFIANSKQDKAGELYDLVTGHEFTQSIERMVDIYLDMKMQVSKERANSEKLWKMRETQIDRLINGVSGIYGSMQGIAGSALPEIKTLEIEG